MAAFLIRRVLWFIPVLFCVGLVTFAIARSTPGGPFDTDPNRRQLPASTEKIIRARFGLDLPLWRQFTRYMFFDFEDVRDPVSKQIVKKFIPGALFGNLGPTYSSRGAQTAQDYLFKGTQSQPSRFYFSARLGLQAVILALAVGIPLGVIAALRQNTWVDYISLFTSTTFSAIGTIILAPILLILFSVLLKWIPVLPNWKDPVIPWILPTLALGLVQTAFIARLTRASVLEVKRQDFIRTARAKGLAEGAVIVRHIVRNSLLPIVTILGPLLTLSLTGALVTETFFSVPGIGAEFVKAIGKRDYSLIMGLALFTSFLIVVGNLISDMLYGAVDPRIRFD